MAYTIVFGDLTVMGHTVSSNEGAKYGMDTIKGLGGMSIFVWEGLVFSSHPQVIAVVGLLVFTEYSCIVLP